MGCNFISRSIGQFLSSCGQNNSIKLLLYTYLLPTEMEEHFRDDSGRGGMSFPTIALYHLEYEVAR